MTKKKAIGEARDFSPDYGYRTFPRGDVIADDEKDSDRDNMIGVDKEQYYMTYSPIRPMGSDDLELGFKDSPEFDEAFERFVDRMYRQMSYDKKLILANEVV